MKKPNYDYPEETKGSKAAREIRASTNHLPPKEREKLFRQGMRKIYAGK